jgi:pimeloyl-ACP methyl ester carboxylesterase
MQPELKPTAVFLPGKLCDSRVWAKQIDQLQDIIKPLFIDLNHQNNLEEMIASIYHSCDHEFILIGFSMGGFVAQEFVLKYPQSVKGLALCGSSAKGYTEKEKAYQLKLMHSAKKAEFQAMSDASLQHFIHPSRYADLEITSLIKEMAQNLGPDVFYKQQQATIERKSRLDILHTIDCPTIVIAGCDDQIVTLEEAKETADNIKNAEFFPVENSGHMLTLEQPLVVSHLLREWINSLINAKKKI